MLEGNGGVGEDKWIEGAVCKMHKYNIVLDSGLLGLPLSGIFKGKAFLES